jgi:Ca-activated chloride channel homolog
VTRRVAAVVLAAVALLLSGPVPGAAADDGTPVMVVLDASGSMNAADAPGPRIDAARKAVSALVGALPADARVGLTAYGTGTGSSDGEKAAGCRDVRQLLPVGPLRPGELTRAVAGLRASGYTPIGRALRQAAAALPATGPRSIVLVSDGEDTCAPPAPCQVAEQLKAAGAELVVHTVGFKVGGAARGELTCIAAATGGTYREASTGAELGTVLSERVERAIRSYTSVGTPVRGGATPAAAPPIGPGQYLDTFARGGADPGAAGTVKYYAPRLSPGDLPYFSATVAPPGVRAGDQDDFRIAVGLVDAGGRPCGDAAVSADTGAFGKVVPRTAVLSPGGSCPGQVYLRVERRGDAYGDQQLPVEIAFRAERAEASPGPAATPAAGLPEPAEGAPVATEAGLSFNDAPLLAPGTYTTTVGTGETRYYRVRLGEGQRLAYRVSVPALPAVDEESAMLRSSLASPVRAPLDQATGTRYTVWAGGDEGDTLHGSTAVPVRPGNRSSPDEDVAGYALDGDYYLVLDLTYPQGSRPAFGVPLTVTVAVDDGAAPGPTRSALPSVDLRPTSAAQPYDEPDGTPLGASVVAIGVLLAAAAAAVLAVRNRLGRDRLS